MHKDNQYRIPKSPELPTAINERRSTVFAAAVSTRNALVRYVEIPKTEPKPAPTPAPENWTNTPTGPAGNEGVKVVEMMSRQEQADLSARQQAEQQARQRLNDVWEGAL